ncbi:hypothetical protein MPSEU_000215700 [Mayamaea pseudoterrestris]|nr:hypothetical protein MPSEU_000215700 [Mayamaea pseudoterrestris]
MSRLGGLFTFLLVLLLQLPKSHGFVLRKDVPISTNERHSSSNKDLAPPPTTTKLYESIDNNKENDANKFGFFQRIESVKCLVIGGVSGSLVFAPVGFVKDLVFDHSSIAQWEFDTDMAAVQGGLFAIVYRYCIRQDVSNSQLNQGVIGAFVLTRTLTSIHVPSYCLAVPLDCGAPFGYVDWNIIGQGMLNGGASAAIFGATAAAIDKAMDKGFLSRFPG